MLNQEVQFLAKNMTNMTNFIKKDTEKKVLGISGETDSTVKSSKILLI